ncbi:MAG: hypothetical protein DVB26_08870 [Verrucomicrobia bacterium]|nr:MAG: hypothetical protein DVB26_08870 [Verrucomicrobiota bacterium]
MRLQRLLCIAALGLTVVSCDKIRDLVSQAKHTMEAKAAAKAAKSAGVPPDPLLQALVDQTPEGAIFRKDLPFPEQLKVKEERRLTFDAARIVVKSAIGNQVAAFSGTRFFTTRYQRTGTQLDLTIESAGFTKSEADKLEAARAAKDAKVAAAKPKPEKVKAAKSKLEQAKADQEAAAAGAAPAVPDELTAIKELTGRKCSFVTDGKGWKAIHSNDFKLAGLARNLEPHLAVLGSAAGVLPRNYWLGQRRLKPGDSVPLAGEDLALLLGEGASGSLVLTLEAFEASGGHPCGVFAVTGHYRQAAVPGPDGEVIDEDVSVSSGKVWLSLLYPLIIRQQFETIQTLSTGMRSGHSTLIQGSVAVAVTRTWKPTAVPAKKSSAK